MVIVGPTIVVDGKEIVSCKSELAVDFGIRSIDQKELTAQAMKLNHHFAADFVDGITKLPTASDDPQVVEVEPGKDD